MSKPTITKTPATHIAAKPLTINGRLYQPGDGIDVSDVNPRRVTQLLERRQIAANTTGAFIVVREPPARTAPPAPRPARTAPPAIAPTGLHVKHFGRSRWAVADSTGAALTEFMAKADAEAALAKMQPPAPAPQPEAPQPGSPEGPAAATTTEFTPEGASGADSAEDRPADANSDGGNANSGAADAN